MWQVEIYSKNNVEVLADICGFFFIQISFEW